MPGITDNVLRTVLPNGLRVLIKENHSSPVSAVLAHVCAGYFNEKDRLAGIAHVIEHMFFKGTSTRPGKEDVAEAVRAIGGSINAGTYYEETSYHLVTPAAHIAKAIEIQADTFLNSLFDAGELERELEVIIQESKQKRDRPTSMLVESLYELAYDKHRIRRWRIGEDDALRALRREDLLDFLDNTYRPENIVLSIVGDFDGNDVLELVKKYWSKMERGSMQKELSPVEPERAEFRCRRMTGDIQQRLFVLGFHAPKVLHEDAAALMILGSLLSDGRSSRLYRSLKEEKGLVNTIWAGYEGFEHTGIFTVGGELVDDAPLPAEKAVFEEINKIIETPIEIEEIQRIRTRLTTRRLFAQEEVLGMASSLAEYEALGDYRLADTLMERLEAVTQNDIRRVVNKYITPERATLMEYLPESTSAPEIAETLITAGPTTRLPNDPTTRSPNDPTTHLPNRHTTAPQIELFFKKRDDLPIVAVSLLFPGGKRDETENNCGITSLMLKSSLKGTRSFNAEEIAWRVESLGSGIGQSLGLDQFGYSIKLPADRLEEGLEILSEVICCPTFPQEQVEREKQSIYGEIRRLQDSMFPAAFDQFMRACFGEQAYGLPSSGNAEAVAALTHDDLHRWHNQLMSQKNVIISVVGDLTDNSLLQQLCADLPESSLGSNGPINAFLQPGERSISVSRQQTASVLGFPGVSLMHQDRYALDLLAEITSGLAGRFFQAVRGENGLAYAVTGFHRARKDSGNFITYTATSPENEELARRILLEECAKLAAEPVGHKELAAAKESLRGEMVIGTQTFGAQAALQAHYLVSGLPQDEMDRYIERVMAITIEDVRNAAEKYLTPDKAWLGVVRGGK